MKALIFADLHSHNFREFSALDDGVNTRLLDCCVTLHKICRCAVERKVDEVWFLGDLFHLKNNLDSQVIQLTMYEMKNLAENFPVFIIPGNHDYRMWSSEPILLELLEEYGGNFALQMKPGWMDKTIYVEPYTRKTKELRERIEKLEVPKGSIFLGHQDIIGMQYGGFTVEHGLDADVLSKKFKWSFIGHYHAPKQDGNVISVGAPLQHSFSDMGGERGWWIFDDEATIEFIRNDFSPEFREEIIEKDEKTVVFADEKNFYRIKVKGAELPEGLEKLKWKRISYEVAAAVKERSGLRFSDAKEDIVEKYVGLKGGDLDHKVLIEIGRKYL